MSLRSGSRRLASNPPRFQTVGVPSMIRFAGQSVFWVSVIEMMKLPTPGPVFLMCQTWVSSSDPVAGETGVALEAKPRGR